MPATAFGTYTALEGGAPLVINPRCRLGWHGSLPPSLAPPADENLFDSPWKVLIVAVVVLVLFGSKKLPVAARSLGRSMRILKSEVSKIHDDDDDTPEDAAPAQALTTAPHQQQIDQLQQQVRDLQQQAAGNGAAPVDAQRTQQPS